MRIIKIQLGTVVTLSLLIFIVGQILPYEKHDERSTVVNADQAAVFALVNDFQQFNRWSPWAE